MICPSSNIHCTRIATLFQRIFIVHGFLPSAFTDTVSVTIVVENTEDPTREITVIQNIALAYVISKVFEISLLVQLGKNLHSPDNLHSKHTSKEPVCPRVELMLKIIIILLIIFLGFIKSKPC